MKSLKTILALLTIATTLTLSNAIQAEPHHQKRNNINITYQTPWSLTNDGQQNPITLAHKDSIATINIQAFYFEEGVTINGFQIKRMTSRYDGWLNLFERPGTLKESAQANVSENYVAVYGKDTIDEKLRVTKEIVGEYYYIKNEGKYGYIITLETTQNHWKAVGKDLKLLVQSFWIGEGDRQYVYIPVEQELTYTWTNAAQNPENHNASASTVNIAGRMTTEWKTIISTKNAPFHIHPPQPTVTKDSIYFSYNGLLIALNQNDGTTRWRYQLQSPTAKNMAYNQDILVFIDEGFPAKLHGVLKQNGATLYKVPLNSESYSSPIIIDDTILIYDGNQCRAFGLSSGDEKWSRVVEEGLSGFPVGNKDYVILNTQSGGIRAISQKTGEDIWEDTKPADPITLPLLLGEEVIITNTTQTEEGTESTITSYQQKTGQLLWQHTLANHEPTHPLSLTDQMLILITKHGDEKEKQSIQAFDIAKKEIVWSTPLKKGISVERPLLTKDTIILKQQEKNALIYDAKTGGKLPSKKATHSQLIHPYDQSVILIKESPKEVKVIKQVPATRV